MKYVYMNNTSAAAATAKIVIKHRRTGAILFEYQPTEQQHASGMAMREKWSKK